MKMIKAWLSKIFELIPRAIVNIFV